MNVLRIALKEMKIAREPQMLVFMLATPVFAHSDPRDGAFECF